MDNDTIFGNGAAYSIFDADDAGSAPSGFGQTQTAALPDTVFELLAPLLVDTAKIEIPAGQTVVHVVVAPGETVELPFGANAHLLARLGDGNLAIKVGDVTVILEGYAQAANDPSNPVVVESADHTRLDIAALLAATDPLIDIQTAAGPGGNGGQGHDNSGGIFQAFDGGAGGPGGFHGVGSQGDSSGPNGDEGTQGSTPTELPAAAINTAASVQDVAAITDEDTKIGGQLVGTDPDGDPLTFHTVGAPTPHVTVNPDGSWFFDPTNSFDYLAAGDHATVSFQYAANDGNTATVTIEVDGLNDAAAVAGATTGDVTEDSGVAATGTLVVTDPDHDQSLAVADSGNAQYGSWSVGVDGHWSYLVDNANATVNALGTNGTLTDSFTVTSKDGTTSQNVAITIHGHNDAPVVLGYVLPTLPEGVSGSIGITTFTSDPDTPAANLSYSTVGGLPLGVTLDTFGDVHIQYAGYDYLAAGESANFSFQYQVFDGEAFSNVGTISGTVTGTNDAASISGDLSSAVTEDSGVAATGTLVVADPDHDQSLAVADSGNAQYGSWSVGADGHWSYLVDNTNATVNALGTNGTLTDSFTVTSKDGTASQQVSITIHGHDDAPVATGDAITVNEGGTVTLLVGGAASVLANDTDAEQDPLTALLVSGPQHGTLTLNPDGTFSYTHDGSETFTDSFTYVANDGVASGNVATVSITINPVNDAPVSINDAITVNEGGTATLLVGGATSVLANDTDADQDLLTATVVAGPVHGALTLNPDGTFTYIHDGSETLTDSFTYVANDGTATGNIATVSITVNPVNDAPVANNDAISVNEGGTATLLVGGATSILANDTDADQEPLTAVLVTGPAHGTLTLNLNGTFSYTHDGSETLTDSFTYKANDGTAYGDIATVSITVNPVNDAPVAASDAYSFDVGGPMVGTSVLANDTDADSTNLTAKLVSPPATGTFTLNADGTFTYTPVVDAPGTTTFTYRASDGTADSNIVTVTITANPVNHPPVAINDAITVAEGGTATTLTGGAISVLADDTDAEHDVLAASVVTSPAHGTLTLNSDGTFTYIHDGSETFTDSFTYVANDGVASGNVATVSITINPVNDAPVSINDAITVNEGGTATLLVGGATSILANDIDAEQDPLTALVVTGPEHGALTLNPDGTFTYVHDGSETLTDSFTYVANDGTANGNVAIVSITVNPVNDAPVAINDAIIVAEGGTATLLTGGANSVLVNDTDAEQNPLTATVLTNPAHGTLTLNLDGTFSYTHDGSENFTDSFTYAANDGAATGNVATVSITVNPVNDQTPVANDDSISVAKAGTATVAVLTNDTDGDLPNDVLTASLASAAAHGLVTLNPDGSFTYVQDGSDSLTDSFTYTVTDAAGHTSNIATVDITGFTPTVLHDDYLFSNVPDIRDVMDGVKSEWLLANDEGQGLTYFTTSFINPPFTEATYGVIDAANGFSIGHIAVMHVDGATIDRSADTLGDIIVGANIASTLTGGHGNDIISGGAANDVIFGNDGTDTIFGNGGDDTIIYSTGDIVHGGDDNFDTHDLSHSLGHLGDKLVFTESIDLTDSKYDGKLDGIETISMRDADPVNGPGLDLTLNASDVMGISNHLVAATSPTAHAALEIDLSASDNLYLSATKDGGTWSVVAAQPSGGDLYLIYGHNNGAGEDAYVMVNSTTGHVHLNQDAPHV